MERQVEEAGLAGATQNVIGGFSSRIEERSIIHVVAGCQKKCSQFGCSMFSSLELFEKLEGERFESSKLSFARAIDVERQK
jgi:hypothetical protein